MINSLNIMEGNVVSMVGGFKSENGILYKK